MRELLISYIDDVLIGLDCSYVCNSDSVLAIVKITSINVNLSIEIENRLGSKWILNSEETYYDMTHVYIYYCFVSNFKSLIRVHNLKKILNG